jgi:hypothetical protein
MTGAGVLELGLLRAAGFGGFGSEEAHGTSRAGERFEGFGHGSVREPAALASWRRVGAARGRLRKEHFREEEQVLGGTRQREP